MLTGIRRKHSKDSLLHNSHTSPENRLAPNVFRLQRQSLQKLVTQSIVEGAVKTRRAAVRLEHPETFHLILPVNQQLGFVAINADQDHILHDRAHIAAQELVGDSVCEKLQDKKVTNDYSDKVA